MELELVRRKTRGMAIFPSTKATVIFPQQSGCPKKVHQTNLPVGRHAEDLGLEPVASMML